VESGNWDLDVIDFKTQYPYYKSLKSCLIDNEIWENTELYRIGLETLSKGLTAFGCLTIQQLKKRIESIKQLYNNIAHQGYRFPTMDRFTDFSDEISVNIGRNGEILFDDGGHRLAIAQLLGIRLIPVQVVVRHLQWDSLREALILEAKRNNGMIYQKVHHPDLEFIPASHDSVERFNIISPHLDSSKGKLLDVGANWGMFCHLFEDLGFDCVAVENDPVHINFMKQLKTAFNKHFQIYTGSIFNLSLSQCGQFEVMLALNIFYHFLKTEKLYNNMVTFLNNLSVKCIFFETHKFNELDPKLHYKNFDENEFAEFVMRESHLKNFKIIGRAKDGRAMFKIW
jgi:hypothetical protein